MIYIDDYQEHELALIIKYTFIIVSRAPIPTAVAGQPDTISAGQATERRVTGPSEFPASLFILFSIF